jgi:hypothetical protein
MRWTLIALLALGCGDSGELTALKASLANAQESIVETQGKQIDKTDEAIGILRENTTALAAIKSQIDSLEASVVSSKPNGKEVIKSAPESPAKANTQQAPLKVATPGASSETLTELATRLYAQGVSVHMKTEEQLKAIDAQLNGGQPVAGGIFQNNRTSAVTSQRSAVRFVPRGKGVVRWQRNTTGQTCGPNGCY